MKILLLGKNGQLGWELQRTLATLGEIIAFDFPAIDLSHPESIRPIIRQVNPQILVNATAYTAVDRAESEPELCRAINAVAPAIMAEETARLKATLFHFSTDYVFDGYDRSECASQKESPKKEPYVETDAPYPLNIYGQSKLEGEQGVSSLSSNWLTFRTSWVYSLRRDSFVSKVLQWSRQQKSIRLVTDQISNPTWARLLAEITSLVIAQAISHGSTLPHPASTGWLKERTGLYHLAGDGQASRLEWGQEIIKADPHKEEQVTEKILPAVTADFPSPAQRPLYSALDCTKFKKTFNLELPPWRVALRMAMESIHG